MTHIIDLTSYQVKNGLPSAKQFLADNFGARASDVRVGGFHGDPGNPPPGAWLCYRAGKAASRWIDPKAEITDEPYTQLDAITEPNAKGVLPNLYFCPFLMRGPRSSANFESAVLIPIDDVGSRAQVEAERERFAAEHAAWKAAHDAWEIIGGEEPAKPAGRAVKIAREDMLAMFGPPTLAMVTSVSRGIPNEQFFYRLSTPCGDGAKVLALLRATGSDAKDLARWVRLPGGANGKAGQISEHGAPFVSQLGETGYDPSRVFDIDEMLARARVNEAAIAAAAPRVVQLDPEAEAKLEFRALAEAGLILEPVGQGEATARAHWMLCPGTFQSEAEGGWLGETEGHTPGLDDRAKVWESGGFRCHHAHCEAKTFNDLAQWVARHPDAGPILNRLTREECARSFAAAPVEDDVMQYAPAMQAVRAAVEEATKPRRRTWYRMGADAPVAPLPAWPGMCSFLARGRATQLVSLQGVGKSQFALLVAVALATERGDILGEPLQRCGGTIIIGNEDDEDEYRRRRNACLEAHGLSPNDLKHEIIGNVEMGFNVAQKTERNGTVQLTSDMAALAEFINAERERGNEIALVVIDTQAASFVGVEENSNTDMAEAGKLLAAWAKGLNVAVLLLHHITKEAGKGGDETQLAARGASSMGASVRLGAMLLPLKQHEEARLPENERNRWFRVHNTKGPEFPPDRWFRKVKVPQQTLPENGSILPGASSVACRHDAKGPQLGGADASDDDQVFLALAGVSQAGEAGKGLLSSLNSSKGARACDVIAEALGCSHASAHKMQLNLENRKWLTTVAEPVPGKGRTRQVVRLTPEGEAFVRARQGEVGSQLGEVATEPRAGHSEVATEGRARIPHFHHESPAVDDALSELPAEGVLDGLGEIDFGPAPAS